MIISNKYFKMENLKNYRNQQVSKDENFNKEIIFDQVT